MPGRRWLLASAQLTVTLGDARVRLSREPDGDLVLIGTALVKGQVSPLVYRLGADLRESCSLGKCKGNKPGACDDGKPCTWDRCDPT